MNSRSLRSSSLLIGVVFLALAAIPPSHAQDAQGNGQQKLTLPTVELDRRQLQIQKITPILDKPVKAQPNDFTPVSLINSLAVKEKLEKFQLDIGSFNAGSNDRLLPDDLQNQFVDVLQASGLTAKSAKDFFADPGSPLISSNNAEVAALSDNARKLIEMNAWEGSSFQKRYGGLLHDIDPKISPGIAAGDRSFYEKLQSDLKRHTGYVEHVVVDDSKVDSGDLVQPSPGSGGTPPPIFSGAANGEAFPRVMPFYSDKAGLLPGVGIIVQKDQLAKVDGGWKLATTNMNLPFGDAKFPPCDEPDSFAYKSRDKPRVDGRVCTSFLLGAADHLVTARHCMQDINVAFPDDVEDNPDHISVRADQYAVVFGFKYLLNVAGNYLAVYPQENVYFLSEASTSTAIAQSDIIELQLDRAVPSDVATPFELDDRPLDDALRPLHFTIAGYAEGLPMNIDIAQPQISQINNKYFGTFFVGADNYGGDSGAPVFDAESRKVVGMMRSGKTDFSLKPPSNQCYVSEVTKLAKDSQEAALHLKSFF